MPLFRCKFGTFWRNVVLQKRAVLVIFMWFLNPFDGIFGMAGVNILSFISPSVWVTPYQVSTSMPALCMRIENTLNIMHISTMPREYLLGFRYNLGR